MKIRTKNPLQMNPLICFIFFAFVAFHAAVSGADGGGVQKTKDLPPDVVKRSQELLEKGNAFVERGNSYKAKEYWKAALELNPGLSEAQTKLNELDSGRKIDSVDEGKKQRTSDFLLKAEVAYEHKNYDLALKYLEPVESLSPDDPRAKALRKKIVLETFEFNSDEENGPLVKNYFDKAVEFYRHKNYTEALKAIQQSEQLEPNQPQVEKLKAIIQEEYSNETAGEKIQEAKSQWALGNVDGALEILIEILNKNPQNQQAIDLQTKIKQLESANREKSANVSLDKARDLEKQNDFLGAKKVYESVLKLDPENKQAQEGLNRVSALIDPLKQKENLLTQAVKSGNKSKAQGYLKDIKDLDPNYSKLKYWQNKINRLSVGDGSDVDSHAKADETYNLGLEAYGKNDFADAEKFWKQTLELEPTHTQAKRNLDRLEQEHPELKAGSDEK